MTKSLELFSLLVHSFLTTCLITSTEESVSVSAAEVVSLTGEGFLTRGALLEVPEVPYPRTGGRSGLHGEELGHMLAEMQILQRSYPGLSW